jgi:flavin reductase (DIM6/NTAB) family NADH-FMN oxidoreductase RutF
MKKNLGASTLVFPAPVFIVGTYNEDGTPNAMNAAWGGPCASNPPAVSVSIRKERKTYENILNKKAFTIGMADEAHMAEADYFGLVSGNNVKKFENVNMTVVKAENVDAPYIAEFPVSLECRVLQMSEIGEHVHIIGEIVNVIADEAVLDAKGHIDIEKAKFIAYDAAANNYVEASHVTGKAFSAGIPLMK